MDKCSVCGVNLYDTHECEYCNRLFCAADYSTHMAWERRHAGIVEEQIKLWKRKRR